VSAASRACRVSLRDLQVDQNADLGRQARTVPGRPERPGTSTHVPVGPLPAGLWPRCQGRGLRRQLNPPHNPSRACPVLRHQGVMVLQDHPANDQPPSVVARRRNTRSARSRLERQGCPTASMASEPAGVHPGLAAAEQVAAALAAADEVVLRVLRDRLCRALLTGRKALGGPVDGGPDGGSGTGLGPA